MEELPLSEYLSDPFLYRLFSDVRAAGPVRSISVDIVEACNLRCAGCYFFAENMDRRRAPSDAEFDEFLEREAARGTNFVTVIGGEPSLVLDRLARLHRRFRAMTVTNGLVPIPREGFETMPIAVSVWGSPETDRKLRGLGRVDVFARALANYRDDPRVTWYFTVASGRWREIEQVTRTCVENGNLVSYNFYSDLALLGGDLDHALGFADARREIDRMIELYPNQLLFSSYMNRVITTGALFDERWGYDVCASVTVDHPTNRARVTNGKLYNAQFRAYNPDLRSTRRCCVGDQRDCSTCLDVWSHTAWVMLNVRKHMGSARHFTEWLTTVYCFYLANRLVDFEKGMRLLPEIHARLAASREDG